MDITSKRIVVTGGAGFLGSYVVEELRARGCKDLFVPRSKDYDLRRHEDIIKLMQEKRPEIIIHLAAVVGGIGANRSNPGKFLYENLIMGTELIEQARLHKVEKFVAVGTICAYPKFTPVPFKEEELWNGYPEETNAPYGLAKKMMLVQLQAYRQQYGFHGIYLLPVNLYGPRDNFDPHSSHVIPALIRKFIEAKERDDKHVEVWGSGKPTREFLYVKDAARAIAMAAEKYDGAEPVNLGSGDEISVKELAYRIKELTGYQGDIIFDLSKPDGQPRRKLDTTRAKKFFGFETNTPLNEGIKETIVWYQSNRK